MHCCCSTHPPYTTLIAPELSLSSKNSPQPRVFYSPQKEQNEGNQGECRASAPSRGCGVDERVGLQGRVLCWGQSSHCRHLAASGICSCWLCLFDPMAGWGAGGGAAVCWDVLGHDLVVANGAQDPPGTERRESLWHSWDLGSAIWVPGRDPRWHLVESRLDLG